MLPPQAATALAALFIVAMVWLRTRMRAARGARFARTPTRAGGCYFAALVLLLVAGWFAAPALARRVAGPAPVAPTLARIVWFLATYYLFIPVHRALRVRGVELFKLRAR